MRWTPWLKAVFTAAAVALLVKMLLVTSCIIPSSGMENSLYQGEGILVNKWSYGLRVPFPSLWGYHRPCHLLYNSFFGYGKQSVSGRGYLGE